MDDGTIRNLLTKVTDPSGGQLEYAPEGRCEGSAIQVGGQAAADSNGSCAVSQRLGAGLRLMGTGNRNLPRTSVATPSARRPGRRQSTGQSV